MGYKFDVYMKASDVIVQNAADPTEARGIIKGQLGVQVPAFEIIEIKFKGKTIDVPKNGIRNPAPNTGRPK